MMAVSTAGPSRLAILADSGTMEHLPSPSDRPSALNVQPLTFETTPPSGTSSFVGGSGSIHNSARLRSRAGSTHTSDSSSVKSTSTHSRDRIMGSIFGRRGSVLTNGRRPKSTNSNRSSSIVHDDVSTDTYEMTPMSRHKKKRIVEDIEKRVDRAKADAALAKWRRWIAEQPVQEAEANPLYPNGYGAPSSLAHGSSESHSARSLDVPMSAPFLQEPSSYSTPTLAGPSSYHHRMPAPPPIAHIPATGPPSSSSHYWNGDGAASSSDASHRGYMVPSTPRSHAAPSVKAGSIIPGAQDIYTTESVRALKDVELAIDPSFYGGETIPQLTRSRRLSTHPRVSDMENPFGDIDALLCRRGIRPLVLELVQALGAYVDAVWSTTHPNIPNPWAGVPLPSAARRQSALSPTSPTSPSPAAKKWHSWTLTAVQEAKRRGLMNNPQTHDDVGFWALEIRYGLRDIDQAVSCRKDMGWAFGEVVVRGQYGDIIQANVFANDGSAGNIPRLLNDLEEALWGDAIPAPSDLAFEHDSDFDPFSVYREGDELIGVETHKQPEVREAELRQVFGDNLLIQSTFGRPIPPPSLSPRSPTSPTSPRSYFSSPDAPALSLPASPKSRSDASPRTPADSSIMVMPNLDFTALGALQELSLEEKLELGRRRHQEYLERTRAEHHVALGVPGVAM